jgi:hypothetical protein
MNMLKRLIIALPLLFAAPAMAQDILGPIQDFVDELTAPPPKRPAPPVAPVAEPPPVPRPRPPSLPDVAPVAVPATPVVEEEAPAAEAEAPVEPEAQPEPEPERVYQVACPAVINGLVEAEMAPPISDGMCGEQSPLVVTGVLVRGRMVPLSSPVTTNCQMASALPGWAETVDGYASSVLESELAAIDTGTSYMCRAVVGGETGRMSEHGFANAVDVTGFTLVDGRSIGVEGNWLPAADPEGRLLRLAHDAACGDFTTVLGPEANAEHHDHLHLDLGCHGQTCMAQICE